MTDESYSRRWAAPSTQNQLAASVSLPGSKSLNNRELVLSALAASPTILRDILVSRDSTLMIEALRKLGTQIEVSGTSVVVTPTPLLGPASIDCGLS
jgi:3-phosphoshikimate 1-carboxyvinyltransferase